MRANHDSWLRLFISCSSAPPVPGCLPGAGGLRHPAFNSGTAINFELYQLFVKQFNFAAPDESKSRVEGSPPLRPGAIPARPSTRAAGAKVEVPTAGASKPNHWEPALEFVAFSNDNLSLARPLRQLADPAEGEA